MRLLNENMAGELSDEQFALAVRHLERTQDALVADGALVIKVFLHTPPKVQRKRIKQAKSDKARGWRVDSFGDYLYYAAVPTLALVLVTLGYNTRFYRAVFIEESGNDHIATARAFGTSQAAILWKHVLKNSMVPIITRVLFSIPLVVISGSLLIETYFGIPGVGRVTFDAITSGDQPVLKAVVGLTAVAFVILQLLAELAYRALDPRLRA